MAIRYGGDEFVIILNHIKNREKVIEICERLHKRLEKPLHYEGHDHTVNINIGAALYPSEAKDITDLIKHADDAMYYAKQHELPLYFFKDLD